jgi:deoxyhypusine synthase
MGIKLGKKWRQRRKMQIYKCYVPRPEYNKVKDVCIRIFNHLRKSDKDSSDRQLDMNIGAVIRERYTKANGTKSVLNIATEYYNELKKEG